MTMSSLKLAPVKKEEKRLYGGCGVWHTPSDCAASWWVGPSTAWKTADACTTIELPEVGLAQAAAMRPPAGVYILSWKEKHAPMTIPAGLEHAVPSFLPGPPSSGQPAARVREASQTFAGHDGSLGFLLSARTLTVLPFHPALLHDMNMLFSSKKC